MDKRSPGSTIEIAFVKLQQYSFTEEDKKVVETKGTYKFKLRNQTMRITMWSRGGPVYGFENRL